LVLDTQSWPGQHSDPTPKHKSKQAWDLHCRGHCIKNSPMDQQQQGSLADLAADPVSSWRDDRLVWLHHDQQTEYADVASARAADEALTIRPCAKTDMWMRTFYTPTLIKCNAPVLGVHLPTIGWTTTETRFTVTPCHQFDQGGLCAYIDDDRWLKAGIEVVDGQPRVSVVVTNRGFSDWSTRSFPGLELSMRLHQRDHSFVVEVQHGSDSGDKAADGAADGAVVAEKKSTAWEFIRIAHLATPTTTPAPTQSQTGTLEPHTGSIVVGVYACCPADGSGAVRFDSLSIVSGSEFDHSN
jgi:regulation of enolase protein 1 (concanavalin A-like superfamily)